MNESNGYELELYDSKNTAEAISEQLFFDKRRYIKALNEEEELS